MSSLVPLGLLLGMALLAAVVVVVVGLTMLVVMTALVPLVFAATAWAEWRHRRDADAGWTDPLPADHDETGENGTGDTETTDLSAG